MKPQPQPSVPCPPGAHGAGDEKMPRGRVPVAGPRLVYTWPVEFEVEPWRP